MHWIPGHYLYYHHAHTASLGPRMPQEAMIKFKPDFYLQYTSDKGLPSLLKTLYQQLMVGLQELCGMLTQQSVALRSCTMGSIICLLYSITYQFENKEAQTGGSLVKGTEYI